MSSSPHCSNRNHARPNAPVRHCPSCGELVNSKIQVACTPQQHAERRKDRDAYCVDCGKKLA